MRMFGVLGVGFLKHRMRALRALGSSGSERTRVPQRLGFVVLSLGSWGLGFRVV